MPAWACGRGHAGGGMRAGRGDGNGRARSRPMHPLLCQPSPCRTRTHPTPRPRRPAMLRPWRRRGGCWTQGPRLAPRPPPPGSATGTGQTQSGKGGGGGSLGDGKATKHAGGMCVRLCHCWKTCMHGGGDGAGHLEQRAAPAPTPNSNHTHAHAMHAGHRPQGQKELTRESNRSSHRMCFGPIFITAYFVLGKQILPVSG